MLIDKILFSDNVPAMMKKSLDFNSQRHMLISSNLSNAETPDFKAQDLDFGAQLRSVLNMDGKVSMSSTNSKHMGPSNEGIKNLEADVFEEVDAAKSNGNNVNVDKEMAKLAENQIQYNATIALMMKRASTVRAAITEQAQ
ncbi:MAG: flagellar basal body rod protein FlgB [Nitrospinae bacterium CG11_big_fil_rev_8_21_14_0_20_45_15]|nr:MAG: flagellar basal body rod protein FlgB [Nitrospinae bacterium CG11_big_fil_rev_8_21_14_0_20_45_15]